MDVGLLPVKRLDAAKSRLSGYLDAGQRVELARAMLEDALDLCSQVERLSWHVLSSDHDVLALAAGRGFEVIEDPPGADLNSSLSHAITSVGPAASSVTIVPVDAPLASVDELHDLIDTGELSDIVVVPAERDAGTNGLYLSPPDLMAPRFGESSLSAYVSEAAAAGLRCSLLPLRGLGIDIDTVEDVERVLEEPDDTTRTVKLLRAWRAPA